MQLRKSTSSGFVMMKTGREGPKYDPYLYTEFTVRRGDHTYTLHEGLVEYSVLDGVRSDKSSPREEFEKVVGVSVSCLEKVLHKPKQCCDKPKLTWENGFPGESLLVCQHCSTIVGTTFSESTII